MKPSDEHDTVECPLPAAPADVLLPEPLSSRVQVDLAALSHQGNVRANNEDHYLVVRGERALHRLLTNLPPGQIPEHFNEVVYGMLVADGMGGAAAGEVASSLAITTLVNLVLNTPCWVMRPGGEQAQAVMDRMTRRYQQIDAVLREEARNNPALAGMGTTMTLSFSVGTDLVLAHIGDSRAYLFRGGKLLQLTRDQTVAQAMVDVGLLAPEEAETHRLRHLLTKVLGGGEDRSEPQVRHETLEQDDQLLLCTDGLTEMVDNATIRAVLSSAASAGEACALLIEQALKNGGKDNVTVALARYRLPEQQPGS
jgi:protein phosphatase